MTRRTLPSLLALVLPSLFLVACESEATRETPAVVAESAAAKTAAAPETGAPATAAPETVAQKPAAATAPTNRTFGEPIKTTEETPIDTIAADPGKFAGKTVRTSGVVQSVCQAAGCWMEIGDDAQRAHIKMAGHAFFVPKDCAGKHAIVEGVVGDGPAVNDCGTKDHCGGADNGAIAKTEIVATGVELLD